MGGRKLAGRGQLCFSVTGFCLIVMWIFKISFSVMAAQIDGTESATVPAWWWQLRRIAFWDRLAVVTVHSASACCCRSKVYVGKVPPKAIRN